MPAGVSLMDGLLRLVAGDLLSMRTDRSSIHCSSIVGKNRERDKVCENDCESFVDYGLSVNLTALV